MSLSLVVKTAKHRMLGLHAAVISPQSRDTTAATLESMLMSDFRSGGEGSLALSWTLYVQMLVFQELKLVLVCISLMVHNVWNAQRRAFARLRAFKKLI